MRKHTIMTAVISFLVAFIGSVGCAGPAKFELSSLKISPLEGAVGSSITIAADVQNVGGDEGIYTATRRIEGLEAGTKQTTVPASDTRTISFQVTRDVPGTYTVMLDGQTGVFKVLKPAEFIVSQLAVTPDKVAAGGKVTVKADIKNSGEVEGTHTVTLKIDGVKVETKDIRVEPGETKSVAFEQTKQAPGTYALSLTVPKAEL